ncbi:protein HIRA-like [Saccostrea echinata]|uniref:protein HIRA-like n=1 Tax=Saccostrea echinata TaxID=191078 RepID=UPI002A7FB29F|nr:protein HIRA-like [Saccostrea echinata]
MRLLKPSWVTHDGKPIFSIDIHPDGSRFATGGQGDDSGKVVIWNFEPVRDEKAENDENVPRVLCQMNNHLACVNCVRWSNNGKSLASGGDDKLIMIWQTSRAGVGPSFGSGTPTYEQWRPAATLRGHTGDVLDLAWSPNDSWMASCSVDNTIIVWNADNFPAQVAVIKGHNGLVKGVTWDPVGKYLASQSDDKSLRVWRTRDWKEEAKITEPFTECGGTTHVLRCHWSPDGAYIVSAHAMNNSGPTAQIIEREGFKTSLDFVGHRKAITVVRFNPNIFSEKMKKGCEQAQQYTCCAIGSKDRSLSVWLTALKRPLVVTHDLFENTILDISWSKSGMELMACSSDGTVAYIEFSKDEIGDPMAQNDVELFLEKIYGKCMTKNKSSTSGTQIIESAALLKLQQQKREEMQKKLPEAEEKCNLSRMSDSQGSPFKPTDKQIETKTADGRRRITPIFLAPQLDVNVGEAPLPFKSQGINFTSRKETSKIVVEKQNIVTTKGMISPTSRSNLSNSNFSNQTTSPVLPPPGGEGTPKSQPPPLGGDTTPKPTQDTSPGAEKMDTAQPSESAPPVTPSKVINVSIQPMTALSKPKIKHSSSEKKSSEKSDVKDKTPSVKDKIKTPSEKSDKVKDHKSSTGVKRKHDGEKKEERRGRPRKVDKERSLLATPVSNFAPPVLDSQGAHYLAAVPELELPVASIQKTFTKTVGGRDSSLSVEVENTISIGVHTLHKMRCVQEGLTLWEQVLNSPILSVTGSKTVVCASCEDGSLHMYSSTGSRILPSIVLDSKVSKLHIKGFFVMVITQKAFLYIWNVQQQSVVIRKESLKTIISGSDDLQKSMLTEEGMPIITVHNKKSYTFSKDMGTWMLLHNKADSLQQCSDHHSCAPPRDSTKIQGPLASLQTSHERLGMQASRIFSAGQSLQQSSTLSHIESQLAACLLLKSAPEYKFWLQTYTRYLSQEGLESESRHIFESKLRDVCDDLLGPAYKTKGKSSWDPLILGMDKRSLLQEMLPSIGSNLKLQRLFTEYHDQLESIEDR